MSSRLDVLVINLSTSRNRLGGAAIAAEWSSRFIADKFPSIELWRMWDCSQIHTIGNLRVRNYETIITRGGIAGILPSKAKALLMTSQIKQDLHTVNPKIVHFQNFLPALEFEKLVTYLQENEIKTVASTHGLFEILYPNYGLKFYEKWSWNQLIKKPVIRALQYVDAIISGYPQERSILSGLGIPDEKIKLIPNGINPFFNETPSHTEINQVLEKFSIDFKKPILLFMGNHTPNKGIDVVLKVASRLSIPSTIVIGGKLLDKEEPRRLLGEVKNSHAKIIFTDFLSLEEQRSLYHASTLLLFPSRADTLPLTILEAMASRLPVLAYDVGGISFQLDNGSGYLISPGDVDSFVDKVEFLLRNPQECLNIASNAYNRRQEIFSWDIFATRAIDLYQHLL